MMSGILASTWFGLRHARHLSCSPSTHSGFEIWVLHFRVLGASFSSLGCSVSEFWVLNSLSRFGSSFSKLPVKRVLFCEIQQIIFCIRDAWWILHGRITRCSCVSGHVVRAKAVRLSV